MDLRITVEDLVEASAARARAEAVEWAAMIGFRDAELARIVRIERPMQRLVETAGIAKEIALAMGLSEGQVVQRLAAAERLTEHAPLTWLSFISGGIDAARAKEISLALGRLERAESKRRLDETVVPYAETHTAAELRGWLKRFVARVEADLAVERANAERDKRHVEVTHLDDGMAWLSAYLPSHHAAAIENRLRREAKALGAGDDRSKAQREADALLDLLVNGTTDTTSTEPGIRADIAVTIDAKVLTSLTTGHAASADGSWSVPAEWVLESALAGEAFWHLLLVDPIIGDTLAHQYVGRFAPDVLARAIAFRDGTCSGDACLRPASECDLDHVEPWPDGRTEGSNLDPKCRREHALKGHGVLERILARHHARGRGNHRVRHRPPPEPDRSELEHVLAWRLADRLRL